MTYTTHGLMTPADLAEYEQDHDTALDSNCPGHYEEPGPLVYCSIAMECPGEPNRPLDYYSRISLYRATNGCHRLTPAQRRRAVKKAAREGWHIARNKRGAKQLAF